MHTIRLRGPWQLEPVFRWVPLGDGRWGQRSDNLPAATKMQMPADWSAAFGADFFGRVRYERKFHTPPGLVPEERVWLVVEPQRSQATVSLEGAELGVVEPDRGPQRFDITDRLQPFSRLEIVVDHPIVASTRNANDLANLPAGGLVGEVRLEIEE